MKMLVGFLSLLALTCAAPAFAFHGNEVDEGMGTYINETYDFRGHFPPGFEPHEVTGTGEDVTVLTYAPGNAVLKYWGGRIAINYMNLVGELLHTAAEEGFLLEDRAQTPTGLFLGGNSTDATRRRLYEVVQECEGTRFAVAMIEFDIEMEPAFTQAFGDVARTFSFSPTVRCD